MSKVLGPLLSLSARQTFGKTLTFSNWKGVNTVRLKSNPSNPKTTSQMSGRAYFAAGGKITKVSDASETLATYIKTITPAQQSWSSYFIANVLGSLYANIIAVKAEYENGANATVAGYFDDVAAGVGLQSVDLDGTANTQIPAGLSLMAAYEAAHTMGATDAPSTAVTATEAQVKAFGKALTGITVA